MEDSLDQPQPLFGDLNYKAKIISFFRTSHLRISAPPLTPSSAPLHFHLTTVGRSKKVIT
jgi:hypothetical protein